MIRSIHHQRVNEEGWSVLEKTEGRCGMDLGKRHIINEETLFCFKEQKTKNWVLGRVFFVREFYSFFKFIAHIAHARKHTPKKLSHHPSALDS